METTYEEVAAKATVQEDQLSAHDDRPKLVILGTGFASYSLLKHIDCELYHVIVVSPRNYFLFTPLLHSSTVGTVEFRSIIEPIRKWRRCVDYFQAECTEIDNARNTIICRSIDTDRIFKISYNFLVIGIGAVNNTFGVPGVNEHALFLKELRDARKIRQRILTQFERACVPGLTSEEKKIMLSFVIVGGGPTGVEFAAELSDMVTSDIRKIYPSLHDYVSITLLEASDRILSSFDKHLAEYTLRLFQRKMIRVTKGLPVTKVLKDAILLRDGRVVPYGVLIWSTGIGPTTLVQALNFPKDMSNRILTDDHLHVSGTENIFAAGDCATMETKYLPATAQIAQQGGRYLANCFNLMGKGKGIYAFHDRNMGVLAYVGGRRALLDLPKVKGKGFAAFVLWRSIYLTKLVSTRNKILVLIDWFKTIVFGRDVSNF
ncbi:MAG: FAD-dependent oxidoreductase [Candidatus Kryptoniota bacterium]